MTDMLHEALAKLGTLAPEDQDRFARWILEEVPDEAHWDDQFSRSQTALRSLAEEARAERP